MLNRIVWVQIFFLHYNTYAKHVTGQVLAVPDSTVASRTQDLLAGHIIGHKQSSNQDYIQMPPQMDDMRNIGEQNDINLVSNLQQDNQVSNLQQNIQNILAMEQYLLQNILSLKQEIIRNVGHGYLIDVNRNDNSESGLLEVESKYNDLELALKGSSSEDSPSKKLKKQIWKEGEASYSYLPNQINQQKAHWEPNNERVDGHLSPIFTRLSGKYPLAADFYMRKLKKRGYGAYGDDPRKMIPYPRLG